MLSIILPCLNEAKNIEKVVKDISFEISNRKITAEIIIVDDGSTDQTFAVSTQLKKKYRNIRVIKHLKNKGFGAAFWTGVKNAQGTCLIMIPGDGESDIAEALKAFSMINEVDLIIPYVYNKINRTFLRRFISKLYTAIINLIFNTNLNYTNGTVIYKTTIIRDINLNSKGFFFQTELLMRLIKSGYLYCEIPVFLKKRSSGASKAISIKSLFSVSIDLINTFVGIYITKRYLVKIKKTSSTKRRISFFQKNNAHAK